MSKGLELPVSIPIITAAAALVLISVAAFFFSSSSSQIDRTGALSGYYSSCKAYCSGGSITTSSIAQNISADKKFLEACSFLGYSNGTSAAQQATYCISACPCDITSSYDADRSSIVYTLQTRKYG